MPHPLCPTHIHQPWGAKSGTQTAEAQAKEKTQNKKKSLGDGIRGKMMCGGGYESVRITILKRPRKARSKGPQCSCLLCSPYRVHGLWHVRQTSLRHGLRFLFTFSYECGVCVPALAISNDLCLFKGRFKAENKLTRWFECCCRRCSLWGHLNGKLKEEKRKKRQTPALTFTRAKADSFWQNRTAYLCRDHSHSCKKGSDECNILTGVRQN